MMHRSGSGRGLGRALQHGMAWTLLALLIAPVLHATWVSFSPDSFLTPPTSTWSWKWYIAFWNDGRWFHATLRSLLVSLAAGLLSVTLGTLAVAGRQHLSRRGRICLSWIMLLPVLIPPAALGFGLLPLMHLSGMWGSLTSLILVNTVLGLPVAWLILRLTWTHELQELILAAEGLGARPWQVATRVTLPLLRPGLIAALIAVFVLTLNESLISIFLATPSNEPLPAGIWPQLRYAATPMVAVGSSVTALVGIITVAGWLWFLSRRSLLRGSTTRAP